MNYCNLFPVPNDHSTFVLNCRKKATSRTWAACKTWHPISIQPGKLSEAVHRRFFIIELSRVPAKKLTSPQKSPLVWSTKKHWGAAYLYRCTIVWFTDYLRKTMWRRHVMNLVSPSLHTLRLAKVLTTRLLFPWTSKLPAKQLYSVVKKKTSGPL